MQILLTLQAICLFTRGAFVVLKGGVKFKHTGTPSSGAPAHFFVVFVDEVLEGELVKFIYHFLRKILLNVCGFDVDYALFCWTCQGELLASDHFFHGYLEAFLMENVSTSQNTNIIMLYLTYANRTLGADLNCFLLFKEFICF